MNLIKAFDIRPGDVVSLVGAGGKTTLMFALAGELRAAGQPVITTATTRLAAAEPNKHGSPCLLLEKDPARLLQLLPDYLAKYIHVTLGTEINSAQDKMIGISARTVDEIAARRLATVIVEADGARGKPIKAPNATEPVIPSATTLVIPVVGMDALGAALTEANAFRFEIIAELTGLKPCDPITGDAIATLITHPQGIAKGTPANARLIPLLNKVDKSSAVAAASLARRILTRDKRIHQVVLGQLQSGELSVVTVNV